MLSDLSTWHNVELPEDDTEYNRLLNICARRVIEYDKTAWCGEVISGKAGVGTFFIWSPLFTSNFSEGCSGPLMAWFEAMEVVRNATDTSKG
jgi:hypothetical protein